MKTLIALSTLLLLSGCATTEKPQQDFAQIIPCNKDNCGKLPTYQ